LVGNRGGAQAQYGVAKEQKEKRPWQAAVGAKEKGRGYSRPLWAQMVIGVWLVILYSFLHLPHFATMQEGDFLTKRRRLQCSQRNIIPLQPSFMTNNFVLYSCCESIQKKERRGGVLFPGMSF
jgi:hypothetical protein